MRKQTTDSDATTRLDLQCFLNTTFHFSLGCSPDSKKEEDEEEEESEEEGGSEEEESEHTHTAESATQGQYWSQGKSGI